MKKALTKQNKLSAQRKDVFLDASLSALRSFICRMPGKEAENVAIARVVAGTGLDESCVRNYWLAQHYPSLERQMLILAFCDQALYVELCKSHAMPPLGIDYIRQLVDESEKKLK